MAAPESWTLLHAKVHRSLRQRHLVQPRQRLLVAVSGGQDSLCLMRLLLDLQAKWHWQLAIAHCNHGWRPDAVANAEYVEQLAASWRLPYYTMTAPDHAPKSEAAARQWRYQVLTDIALQQGYACVLTGHTASDRAETLLYNLIRGSGADGLQALTWRRELADGLALVRPLLDVTRTETAQFCQAAGLDIWEDSTNQDWRYARNRIRQELIPYLQTHFNPQVEQALAQTAELLQAEVDYLQNAGERLWQQAIDSSTPAAPAPEPIVFPAASPAVFPKLKRSVLRAAPLALQRRAVKQFLRQILPIAPSFEHIEKLVALIAAPNRTQTDPFPGGAIAQVEGEWIRICPRDEG